MRFADPANHETTGCASYPHKIAMSQIENERVAGSAVRAKTRNAIDDGGHQHVSVQAAFHKQTSSALATKLRRHYAASAGCSPVSQNSISLRPGATAAMIASIRARGPTNTASINPNLRAVSAASIEPALQGKHTATPAGSRRLASAIILSRCG